MINKLTINYKHSHTAVIGIYYPNGVFTEDYTQGGMSYILDHALFTLEGHGEQNHFDNDAK